MFILKKFSSHNFTNKLKPFRWFLDKIIGIHKDRKLPELATNTFEKWFKSHNSNVTDPIDKVVIFGTCYTNSNDVDLGVSAVEILEHNNVECVYPKQQCCGAPHLSPGDFDSFKTQANPNVEELYKKAHHVLNKNLVINDADLEPFQSLNDLLFFGPYLAERDVSVGKFIEKNPDACHPIVRNIIKGSRKFTAADAFKAIYKTAEIKQITQKF